MNHDLGGDCISRSQAIERLKLNFPVSAGADNSKERYRYMQALADVQAIRELPPVTPQEPKDKIFTKAELDSIVKAINEGWELRVNEILDKLRSEIETKYGQCNLTEYIVQYDGICTDRKDIGDIADILQIIDKYKAESE